VQRPRQKSPHSSIEILHLQRSIRRMEAASKKIMLERLREEWTEIADASVYRELELEKQMWMLTALRSFDGRRNIDGSRCGTPVFGEQRGLHRIVEGRSERRRRRGVNERGKVLSLYENHGQYTHCYMVADTLADIRLSVSIIAGSHGGQRSRDAPSLDSSVISKAIPKCFAAHSTERNNKFTVCLRYFQQRSCFLFAISSSFVFHSSSFERVPSCACFGPCSSTTITNTDPFPGRELRTSFSSAFRYAYTSCRSKRWISSSDRSGSLTPPGNTRSPPADLVGR
jgi:hypothetical protein